MCGVIPYWQYMFQGLSTPSLSALIGSDRDHSDWLLNLFLFHNHQALDNARPIFIVSPGI